MQAFIFKHLLKWYIWVTTVNEHVAQVWGKKPNQHVGQFNVFNTFFCFKTAYFVTIASQSWRLQPRAYWQFVQQFAQARNKENSKIIMSIKLLWEDPPPPPPRKKISIMTCISFHDISSVTIDWIVALIRMYTLLYIWYMSACIPFNHSSQSYPW